MAHAVVVVLYAAGSVDTMFVFITETPRNSTSLNTWGLHEAVVVVVVSTFFIDA